MVANFAGTLFLVDKHIFSIQFGNFCNLFNSNIASLLMIVRNSEVDFKVISCAVSRLKISLMVIGF